MKHICIFLLLLTRAMAQPPTVLITGRVTGYVTNRIGDYEGLWLQPAAGYAVALRFPPHVASLVVKAGPVGQRVDAEARPPHPGRGRMEPGPGRKEEGDTERDRPGYGRPGQYRLLRLSQPATGAGIDLDKLPPPPPKTGTFVQAEGKLTGTFTDDRGHLVGLLIDKMYLLELKPHQSDLLRTILATARQIGFSGYQRPSAGFVNQTGRAVVRPQTLTIDGKTYAF